MDFKRFHDKLSELGALCDTDTIQFKTVERVKPELAENWPRGIHLRLLIALRNAGFVRPYKHQAQAIQHALNGSDVVLESPTASGKTLSFAVPMINALLQNPGSYALMLYPMKALAHDQQSQLQKLCNQLGLRMATYDGDTSKHDRKQLQHDFPHILLTNPEILNNSILAHRDTIWKSFLSNLSFMVIDEMHEYRGIFGSNVSLTLRRLFLQLSRMGAAPKVFLSTATCANPGEHATNLTGRDLVTVSAANAMQPTRHYVFVDIEVRDNQFWSVFQRRIVKASLSALANDLQLLIFCPTKRFISTTLIECRKMAADLGLDGSLLEEYYADLKPTKRRSIQDRIKSGKARVILTTNALELGLDIGGLDGVILAGFPSSIMSARQQIGRAGREISSDAFVLFYAMNYPIDHFFVRDIEAFLEKPSDHLVADPGNDKLMANHLPSLVEETRGRLLPGDRDILGSRFYCKALKSKARPVTGIRKGALQYELSTNLRGGFGQSYGLQCGSETLGKVSDIRRFRELYLGSIFPIMGRKYKVVAHKERVIVLEPAEEYLRTDPHFYTYMAANPPIQGEAYDNTWEVFYGSVTVNLNPSGYKLIDERTDKMIRRGAAWDPFNRYNLHAVWFSIPHTGQNVEGLGAFENLIRLGAMHVIPAERFDTSSSSENKGGRLIAYFFENNEGGFGLSETLYGIWEVAIERGIKHAQQCSCESGCPACIVPPKSWSSSDAKIDKEAGISLARRLLDARRNGRSHVYRGGSLVAV